MARIDTAGRETPASSVLLHAILLSILGVWIPVFSAAALPAGAGSEVRVMVWILALVPAFLFAHGRGWRGAATALAGGMVVLSGAQLLVSISGTAPPSTSALLGATAALVIVSLGGGTVAASLRRSLERAEHMAGTDAMTGLPNRRSAMDHLRRAFLAAERGQALSVVLFNVDRCVPLSNAGRRQRGDDVLAGFARILRRETSEMDLSARFGSRQFLTVLSGANGEDAARFAERVQAALTASPASCRAATVSAGVSEHESGMASPDVLVAVADQALYQAKQNGTHRVVRAGQTWRRTAGPVSLAELPEPDTQYGNELILLVDDDTSVLHTVAMALRRRGYRVLESEHPARALEVARGLDEPLDLVVTDVVMPEMSGFRLVEILALQQPAVRALYISGYGRDAVEWAGVPGSVSAFLAKPFTLDELTDAVRRTLAAPATRVAGPSDAESPAVDAEGNGRSAPAGAGRGPIGNGGALDTGATEPVRSAASSEGLQARVTAQSAQLREAYAELLLRLARAAEYRDDDTGRHAERVGIVAGLLARAMGLNDEFAARLTIAAPLHDIGKIAVPDSILNKPGELTPAERAIMDEHCGHGAELLSGSSNEFVREAERIARSHHEHWDGGGYPDGLVGEAIPLAARITAVADTFDSLTSMRPYRGPRHWQDAVEVIRRERGKQFDPRVVDALVQLAGAGRLVDDALVPVFGSSRAVAS